MASIVGSVGQFDSHVNSVRAARPELGVYGPVIDQDMPNLPRMQRGLKATRKPGITRGNYKEIRVRHFHNVLEEYLAR